ncbi:MAG: hypothetical protein CBC13_00535 [Planctomycetia bacterium TMED53]|nr:MAG: hypothetical protein CBC13_00535 [Planctomycetia bacterium TMED53]
MSGNSKSWKLPLLSVLLLILSSGCQGWAPQQREFSQELIEERLRRGPLQAVTGTPKYILLEGYPAAYRHAIAEGIDAARNYFGEFGPVRVYVLGRTEDGADSAAAKQDFLRHYCEPRSATAPRGYEEDCAGGPGQRLLDVATSGGMEAYQSLVIHTDPPYSELVFINAHAWGESDMPLRGIHEYVHVFQCSHPEAPGWLMEGGAVFFEVWLGAQNGWVDPRQAMRWSLKNALEAMALGKGLVDMEYTRDLPAAMRPFHRQVAYDMGCWAVTYMIGNSPGRSVAGFRDSFYSLLEKSGWRTAVTEYCGVESVEAFYRDFERFMQQPTEDQLQFYESLRP